MNIFRQKLQLVGLPGASGLQVRASNHSAALPLVNIRELPRTI